MTDAETEQLYAAGFVQYDQGRWDEAAQSFRLLCTRRPLEGKFWFGLGASLQAGWNYVEALPVWAMTAFIRESDPLPHFHAAECYLSLEDVEEAGKALREAEKRSEKLSLLQEKIAVLQTQWGI